MKKTRFGLLLILSLVFLLFGCEDGLDLPYSVNESVTITNVQVKKMDSTNYDVTFTKDKKDYKFDIEYWLYSDIEKIMSTAKMLNKDEWVYFDIVTDGEQLIAVTHSNNKK